MANNITELVFILDKSGSMSHLKNDTIGGFNSMIEKQRKQDCTVLVSTVLFSTTCEVLHDRKNLNDISLLTQNDYCPYGGTALYDALGKAIHHIGNIHKYSPKDTIPDKTIFIITTDGMENSSCKYTSSKIKEMINRQQQKYGWEFLFLAANIDAEESASHIGIRKDRAVNYSADKNGTEVLYKEIAETVTHYRKNGSIRKDWSNNINATNKR